MFGYSAIYLPGLEVPEFSAKETGNKLDVQGPLVIVSKFFETIKDSTGRLCVWSVVSREFQRMSEIYNEALCV